MAWWKKALIYVGIGIVLIGVGYGAASLIYGLSNADLRERVEQLNKQYDEATAAKREADATIKQLEERLGGAAETISRLEGTVGKLTGRVRELEGTIEQISAGLIDLEGTTTESGGLIQESLRILLAISKRSTEADK